MTTNYGARPGLTVEPILHVRTKCGEKDLRCYRSVWSRRKGSDATVCGAPVDAHTLGRKTGEAMLRLPHWRAQLCPACADKLAAIAQARGSRGAK